MMCEIRCKSVLTALLIAVALTLTGCAAATGPSNTAKPAADTRTTPTQAPSTIYSPPNAAMLTALPIATYGSVIPQLLRSTASPKNISPTPFTLIADSPLYGDDLLGPIAVLPQLTTINKTPTVVVVSQSAGAWSRVLTPSRRTLPSKDPQAAAQTAAWIRTDRLIAGEPVTTRVVISLSKLTLDLVDVANGAVTATFPVAVGAAETASPVGTGFIEARYSDPVNQAEAGVISLTSLHSTAADSPFGPGGLIAIHRYPRSVGAVSHGCFRISDSTAANIIAKVQVGSLVTVTA